MKLPFDTGLISGFHGLASLDLCQSSTSSYGTSEILSFFEMYLFLINVELTHVTTDEHCYCIADSDWAFAYSNLIRYKFLLPN